VQAPQAAGSIPVRYAEVPEYSMICIWSRLNSSPFGRGSVAVLNDGLFVFFTSAEVDPF
jgi:hypothetical protein